MKNIFKITVFILLALTAVNVVLAQAPEQFKYQAVLRDATGNIIPLTAKTVIINVLQGSATGTSVYQETHSVTTTAQGVINLNIGGGTVNAGVFANINWCANPYWVKVTVDGTVISTGQLVSVPYSLHVKGINVVSGNVGIGTTTPAALLDLYGTAPQTNVTVKSNNTSLGPELRLISTATGGREWRIVSGASVTNSYGAGSFELYDASGGGARFGILPNGNIGIGTTSPQNKLHVAGFVQLEGNPDAQVVFGTTGTNGKRGIGSLAGWDATKLYVNGWGDFTGGVSIGKWGGTTETSDLYVQGNYNWAPGKNFVLAPPYAASGAGDFTFDFQNADGNGIWAVYAPTYGYILTARNNGKVGIGTDNPQSKVHVLSSDPRTNLLVESNSTTFGPELRLTSTAAGGHEWRVVSGASASNSYGAGSFELYDLTAAASRFGILPNGNVGIGTTNPQNKLHVAGFVQLEGNPDAQVVFGTTGTNGKRGIGSLAGWNPNMLYLNGWGDFTAGVSVGGNFTSDLYVNGNYHWNIGKNILLNGLGTIPNDFTFDFDGASGNEVWGVWDPTHGHILAVRNNGRVGIGTSNPGALLDIAGTNGTALLINSGGDIRFVPQISGAELWIANDDGRFGIWQAAPYAGTAYMNGTSWSFVSDARLKENIVTLDNALPKVLQLRGVYYNLIANPGKKEIGVIAQEVQAQFPELVTADSKGYLSVSYDHLAPILIEAIKELNAKVENLESENAALKAENSSINALRAEVEDLKILVKAANTLGSK